MTSAPDPSTADWLGICRRSVAAVTGILAAHPTTAERAVETGAGEGGDQALVIDRAAEDAIFAELDALRAAGHRFTAVSEERGTVDFGGGDVRVVIDPLDGSMNAKRGLPHHAISLAVATGPTMADVVFGFVHDFGASEEWRATLGGGAWLDGARLDTTPRERRVDSGKLELLGIESADPRWVYDSAAALRDSAHRIRAIGAIAVSLCQVAAARLDGLVTLKGCRSVDAAAGQLIVREAGGLVAFPRFEDPLAAPLDLLPHSPLVAARTPAALAELSSIPR